MKRRLPSRLSPDAKKRHLLGAPGERVAVLVGVAPAADPDAVGAAVAAAGGELRAWLAEPRLLTADVPVERLAAIAEIDGVVTVETAARLSH
ncbi:MAG TPA: hypothetical protein VF100_12335 [Thermoanaerobaculia bacterium]